MCSLQFVKKNENTAKLSLMLDVKNPSIKMNGHTAWLHKDNQKALTETGAFGSCTGTSRTQVSSPVHKFQLQVCPMEIHRIINILRIIKVKRTKCSQTILGKMSLTVTQQSHYILMTTESTFQKGSLMAKPSEMSHNDMTILLCDTLPCTQNTLE